MKNGIPYCTYKRTENMYCNALTKHGNVEIECKDCFGTFKTQDCFKQHKKNQMCKMQKKCKKCNKFIIFRNYQQRKKTIDDHDCNIDIRYCEHCKKEHNRDQECKLTTRNITDWQNFPKLCLIAASVSDINSFVDCIECDKEKFKCKFHKKSHQKDSFVNFMYILREINIHGIFRGVYVTENEVENQIKHFDKSYEPKVNASTNSELRKTRFGKSEKDRNKENLKDFYPENAMDQFLKEIMENETYKNSVGIIETPVIMEYIIKSLDKMKVKIDLEPGKTRLDLSFMNFSFICIENYLKEYTSFTTEEKNSRYFPLGLNFREFYNYGKLPDLSYFQFLSDSRKEIEKKKLFWITLQQDWTFLKEMKQYLLQRVEKLLEATVKLTKLAFDIQNMLRENYSDSAKFPIGSIFRARNNTGFFYTLLIHYSVVPLEVPVYAFKFEEKGIDISGTSTEEYIYQKFLSWKFKDAKLQGSYLSPYGGATFDNFRPDAYEENTKTAYLYHG